MEFKRLDNLEYHHYRTLFSKFENANLPTNINQKGRKKKGPKTPAGSYSQWVSNNRRIN
jgi:hypothetical protein